MKRDSKSAAVATLGPLPPVCPRFRRARGPRAVQALAKWHLISLSVNRYRDKRAAIHVPRVATIQLPGLARQFPFPSTQV